jgi:hypothetical protein
MQSGELWRKEDDEKSRRCQIDKRRLSPNGDSDREFFTC